MKTIFDHIETIKAKPHHVRKRVVYGVSAAVTGVIALVWLSASLATNAFALKLSSFAASTGQEGVVATSPDTTGGDAVAAALAGQAAAVLPAATTATGKPRILIVTATSAPAVTKPEATTIPF